MDHPTFSIYRSFFLGLFSFLREKLPNLFFLGCACWRMDNNLGCRDSNCRLGQGKWGNSSHLMRDFTQFSCFRRALLRLQLVWCLVTQQIASMERESHLIVQAKTRARGGVFNRFLDRLFNHRCPRWHSPFLQASQVLAVSCFGDIHFAMTARRGASIRTVVLIVWSWVLKVRRIFIIILIDSLPFSLTASCEPMGELSRGNVMCDIRRGRSSRSKETLVVFYEAGPYRDLWKCAAKSLFSLCFCFKEAGGRSE